jgi:hypothetical protein
VIVFLDYILLKKYYYNTVWKNVFLNESYNCIVSMKD